MRRIVSMIVALVLVIAWLAFAYLPGDALPTLTWPAWMGPLFAVLCAGVVVSFVAIQIRVVQDTSRAVRDAIQDPENAEFGLSVARERFWTALPIAITLAVAIVSFPVWRALW